MGGVRFHGFLMQMMSSSMSIPHIRPIRAPGVLVSSASIVPPMSVSYFWNIFRSTVLSWSRVKVRNLRLGLGFK